MTRWGAAVLERLALRGDETVLDAGCGSGRVTELLAERLPHGRVDRPRRVAGDGRRGPPAAGAGSAIGSTSSSPTSDGRSGCPAGPVDAILSTATFHWVPDHDALFRNLAAVLRPGGRLVAQCGGAGNIASVQAILATIGDGWLGRRHFETPEATADRLAAAGFVDIETWLQPEPTRFEPGEPLETFLRTVILGGHLARLPAEERDALRPRGRRAAGRAGDRLRPAEHRRDARAERASATSVRRLPGDPERLAVARGSRCRPPRGPAPGASRGPPGPARTGRSPASGPGATTGGSARRRASSARTISDSVLLGVARRQPELDVVGRCASRRRGWSSHRSFR